MTASVSNISIPPYPNYSLLIHPLKDDPTQAAHLCTALQDDGFRVLMVDDDPLLLDVHIHMLRSAGMEVHTLSNPLQMMEMLHDFTPDVAVLDVHMPGASGPELAAVLRERKE